MKINRKERKSEEEMKIRFYYAKAQYYALKGKQFKFRMKENKIANPKNQPMKTTNTLKLWAKQ